VPLWIESFPLVLQVRRVISWPQSKAHDKNRLLGGLLTPALPQPLPTPASTCSFQVAAEPTIQLHLPGGDGRHGRSPPLGQP